MRSEQQGGGERPRAISILAGKFQRAELDFVSLIKLWSFPLKTETKLW